MYIVTIITIQNGGRKMTKKKMTEFDLAAKAMNEAGYKNITADIIEKSENQYGATVYIAVVGDAMAIYTPQYRREPVKFVCF